MQAKRSGQMFKVYSSLSIFKPIIFMNIGGKEYKLSSSNGKERYNDTSMSLSFGRVAL